MDPSEPLDIEAIQAFDFSLFSLLLNRHQTTIVYFALQRYFITGLTIVAEKSC